MNIEEPPPRGNSSNSGLGGEWWAKVKLFVDEANGEWVKLDGHFNNGYARHVKTGKLAAFRPAGAYDAVVRKTGKKHPGKGKLYVRRVTE